MYGWKTNTYTAIRNGTRKRTIRCRWESMPTRRREVSRHSCCAPFARLCFDSSFIWGWLRTAFAPPTPLCVSLFLSLDFVIQTVRVEGEKGVVKLIKATFRIINAFSLLLSHFLACKAACLYQVQSLTNSWVSFYSLILSLDFRLAFELPLRTPRITLILKEDNWNATRELWRGFVRPYN